MIPDLAPPPGAPRPAWVDIPDLAADEVTDDGPAIQAALDRAEESRRCDLEAWLEEALRDPLFAWWHRWHRLTRVQKAGEKRVAVTLARTRRRGARRAKTARKTTGEAL